MRAVFLESPCPAANQTQLGVRIETTMPDPTAQKKILAWNPEATGLQAADRRAILQRNLHFASQYRLKPLIRIQLQHPIHSRLIHGRIFLLGEAFPSLDENLGTKRFRDLNRAIC